MFDIHLLMSKVIYKLTAPIKILPSVNNANARALLHTLQDCVTMSGQAIYHTRKLRVS
mgnify:FL=1